MKPSVGGLSVTNEQGEPENLYTPYPHQVAFHKSQAPNLLALGTRNTGKSLCLRMDAILRCLLIPNFRALIIRRTMPELRRSHLGDIPREMALLGGVYLETTHTAKFPNGSTITFAHCERESDVLNFLSSQYGMIGFDELSTFTLTQFLQICAAARAPKEAPYKAVVRAGSNPLGVGASWMKAWFVDKKVNYEKYPDYDPNDYEMIFSTLVDNKSADVKAYTSRLKNLPAHVRRAWLLGEFTNEGCYFEDFFPTTEAGPWHVIPTMPTVQGQPLLDQQWINIYRTLDWGYAPDPAVCHWIAVLPNGHEIVFMEHSWTQMIAADVATQIKRYSAGMRIIETFADPSIFAKHGETVYSVGELIEQNGIPLTKSLNDRELFGYAIHDHLNTLIGDRPKLQILAPQPGGRYGCPDLIRTLPEVQVDTRNERKASQIAPGEDHWVVSLAYFCIGNAPPSRDPKVSVTPRWMLPKRQHQLYRNV